MTSFILADGGGQPLSERRRTDGSKTLGGQQRILTDGSSWPLGGWRWLERSRPLHGKRRLSVDGCGRWWRLSADGLLADGDSLGRQQRLLETDGNRPLGGRLRSDDSWTRWIQADLSGQRRPVSLPVDGGGRWLRLSADGLLADGGGLGRQRRLLEDDGINRPLGGRRWSSSSSSKWMEAVSLSLRGRRRSNGDRP